MYLERVYLLSTICLPKVHAALWVLTRESRRTWWHMTPNSRHLGEQYAATGAVKDVAGVKTTWIKCIRIPRFVGSSSWSSLGKKWKRNTWRLFLSPKFAQTSETSDLARRIWCSSNAAHTCKADGSTCWIGRGILLGCFVMDVMYFWKHLQRLWVFSFVTCVFSFHLRLCKFARSSENSATGCTKHNMAPKPKKNDSLWRNFMYHIGIITRRHSILGDSLNKNREDLILVGFYVGGLFCSEVVKISKVLE